MSELDRKQALAWYCKGIALQTIADHFHLSVEELKSYLNTVP